MSIGEDQLSKDNQDISKGGQPELEGPKPSIRQQRSNKKGYSAVSWPSSCSMESLREIDMDSHQPHHNSEYAVNVSPHNSLVYADGVKTEETKDEPKSALMSNWIAIIPGSVLSDTRLSFMAKVVYAAVSSFTANGTKEAYPSHAQIAERAGLPARSVARPLGDLAQAGFIKVHRRGRRLTNTYEVITLTCDITDACHHSPAWGDNAGERTLSIKRILKRNSTPNRDNAEALYAFYAERVQPGAKTDTIRSITKLLSEHSFEELMGSVIAYAQTPQGRGDMLYRYKPNNFFGKMEYFKDFLHREIASQPSVLSSKALTPEEQKTRQRLIEAGQA